MPWYRVEEISEYRLNTKKLDVWLKGKWGDYDYQIQVHCVPFLSRYRFSNTNADRKSTTTACTLSGPWSLNRR